MRKMGYERRKSEPLKVSVSRILERCEKKNVRKFIEMHEENFY
ncbi:hypothetical protein [Desulfurobacterium sp.]